MWEIFLLGCASYVQPAKEEEMSEIPKSSLFCFYLPFSLYLGMEMGV